ncbi:MAG: protein kinase [Candidatus Rhabdochlamydia sp.]
MAEHSFYKQNTLPELIGKEDIPLPEKIGPYKIESLLNKGGMSLLYLGLDPKTKKPLAIKVLSPNHINHPEAVEHFLREAKAISISNHPNIVKLYGQGSWEKGLYIAMELINGVSLRQFIVQHSLSIRRVLDISLQVAYALQHLHSLRIIHRDVKPENILITEDGEVKLIDFGIAQLQDEQDQFALPSYFIGTPNYMSPEQKENPSHLSFASDLYSLGIILYELISGKLSYGAINLTSIPKGLRHILVKALAISASERYQTTEEFIHDVSFYLQSKELEKEYAGPDQIKQVYEALYAAFQLTLPKTPPSWSHAEIGLAKWHGVQFGLYYDFIPLPNNCLCILLASSTITTIEATICMSSLQGMIHMYIHQLTLSKIDELTSSLNQLLCKQACPITFSALLLDPLQDKLSCISCGYDSLIHVSQESFNPRTIIAKNPALGTNPQLEFSETIDNWDIGDTLILHTFDVSEKNTELANFEKMFFEEIKEHLLFSAQRQAETVLRSVLHYPTAANAASKALICIQRIS